LANWRNDRRGIGPKKVYLNGIFCCISILFFFSLLLLISFNRLLALLSFTLHLYLTLLFLAILILLASNYICTLGRSSTFTNIPKSFYRDMHTSTSSMTFSSISMHLFLYFALILSVNGQSILPSTVSISAATLSESASASSSSQMAWWEKSWDIVVVGSGPAGIIGNVPSIVYPVLPSAFLFSSISILLL